MQALKYEKGPKEWKQKHPEAASEAKEVHRLWAMPL